MSIFLSAAIRNIRLPEHTTAVISSDYLGCTELVN
jgi:hypothetical protein